MNYYKTLNDYDICDRIIIYVDRLYPAMSSSYNSCQFKDILTDKRIVVASISNNFLERFVGFDRPVFFSIRKKFGNNEFYDIRALEERSPIIKEFKVKYPEYFV